MSTQGIAAKYVELSNETYGLIVHTLVTRSRLNYCKSVWEIASRSYASMAIASTVRKNFDRVSELANLTVGELCSRVQRTADYSEQFLAQIGRLQDAAIETYRDSLKSYVSSVDQVKDPSLLERVHPTIAMIAADRLTFSRTARTSRAARSSRRRSPMRPSGSTTASRMRRSRWWCSTSLIPPISAAISK